MQPDEVIANPWAHESQYFSVRFQVAQFESIQVVPVVIDIPCLNAHLSSDWQSSQVGSKSDHFAQYPNPEEFVDKTNEVVPPLLSI